MSNFIGISVLGGGKSSFFDLISQLGFLILVSSASEKGAMQWAVEYHSSFKVHSSARDLERRKMFMLEGSHSYSAMNLVLSSSN
jgi:hypothetical protein